MLVNSLNSLKEFAQNFSILLKKGDVICLFGQIGSGKTTFVREVIHRLQNSNNIQLEYVPSPTFSIMQTYKIKSLKIHHYDFFRLKKINEIDEIGFDQEQEDSISFVEWPDIIKEILPENRLEIYINIIEKNSREFKIKAYGSWQKRIKSISAYN
mgnify:FL=1